MIVPGEDVAVDMPGVGAGEAEGETEPKSGKVPKAPSTTRFPRRRENAQDESSIQTNNDERVRTSNSTTEIHDDEVMQMGCARYIELLVKKGKVDPAWLAGLVDTVEGVYQHTLLSHAVEALNWEQVLKQCLLLRRGQAQQLYRLLQNLWVQAKAEGNRAEHPSSRYQR